MAEPDTTMWCWAELHSVHTHKYVHVTVMRGTHNIHTDSCQVIQSGILFILQSSTYISKNISDNPNMKDCATRPYPQSTTQPQVRVIALTASVTKVDITPPHYSPENDR